MVRTQTDKLSPAFECFRDFSRNYFSPWTYEKPLLISKATNEKVAQLQKIMYKMIHHLVENYDDYEHLIPLDKRSKRVLSFFENKPYQIGSYRTDFVIDENRQFRLIEITCRFAFNGYWVSGFLDSMAKEYANEHKIEHQFYYDQYLKHLDILLENREIVILSHKGRGEESRHYVQVLERAGYQVKKVFVDEIEAVLEDVSDKVFITEFNQEDYYILSDWALSQLAKAKVINDPRTVFIIHDKRFFSVMGNKHFRAAILTKEEIELLNEFYIPTYTFGEREDIWTAARQNKDQWILKHKHLGKSAEVYAGPVTSPVTWKRLFEEGAVEEMILQPFIQQPRFEGKVQGVSYKDYVVGTMLFFDDKYMGLGIFRASSHPVSNVVDDRKIMHLNISDFDNNNFQVL